METPCFASLASFTLLSVAFHTSAVQSFQPIHQSVYDSYHEASDATSAAGGAPSGVYGVVNGIVNGGVKGDLAYEPLGEASPSLLQSGYRMELANAGPMQSIPMVESHLESPTFLEKSRNDSSAFFDDAGFIKEEDTLFSGGAHSNFKGIFDQRGPSRRVDVPLVPEVESALLQTKNVQDQMASLKARLAKAEQMTETTAIAQNDVMAATAKADASKRVTSELAEIAVREATSITQAAKAAMTSAALDKQEASKRVLAAMAYAHSAWQKAEHEAEAIKQHTEKQAMQEVMNAMKEVRTEAENEAHRKIAEQEMRTTNHERALRKATLVEIDSMRHQLFDAEKVLDQERINSSAEKQKLEDELAKEHAARAHLVGFGRELESSMAKLEITMSKLEQNLTNETAKRQDAEAKLNKLEKMLEKESEEAEMNRKTALEFQNKAQLEHDAVLRAQTEAQKVEEEAKAKVEKLEQEAKANIEKFEQLRRASEEKLAASAEKSAKVLRESALVQTSMEASAAEIDRIVKERTTAAVSNATDRMNEWMASAASYSKGRILKAQQEAKARVAQATAAAQRESLARQAAEARAARSEAKAQEALKHAQQMQERAVQEVQQAWAAERAAEKQAALIQGRVAEDVQKAKQQMDSETQTARQRVQEAKELMQSLSASSDDTESAMQELSGEAPAVAEKGSAPQTAAQGDPTGDSGLDERSTDGQAVSD